MEKRRVKKDVRLGTLLARYIVTVVLLLGITGFAFYRAVIYLYSDNGVWRSASRTEDETNAWLEKCSELGFIDTDSVPEKLDIITEDGNGNETFRQCAGAYEKGLEEYRDWVKENGVNIYRDGQEFYVSYIVNKTDGYIFMHYSVAAENENLLFVILLSVLSLELIIPTVLLIRRIRKSINLVSEYAREITAENLSMEPARSGIKEMNEIVEAVDFMKENLVKSMEEKWRDEEKKKEEKAQIAHDLKTPLTIIRGNADLLLESCKSEEDREAIETIIKNSERIARSVLDILE